MSEIKPALTGAEQQAQVSRPGAMTMEWAKDAIGCTLLVPDGSQVYATLFQGAFLCLHEQPFGFRSEDVGRHRTEASRIYERGIKDASTLKLADWHASMADRIEALLPPEKP